MKRGTFVFKGFRCHVFLLPPPFFIHCLLAFSLGSSGSERTRLRGVSLCLSVCPPVRWLNDSVSTKPAKLFFPWFDGSSSCSSARNARSSSSSWSCSPRLLHAGCRLPISFIKLPFIRLFGSRARKREKRGLYNYYYYFLCVLHAPYSCSSEAAEKAVVELWFLSCMLPSWLSQSVSCWLTSPHPPINTAGVQ